VIDVTRVNPAPHLSLNVFHLIDLLTGYKKLIGTYRLNLKIKQRSPLTTQNPIAFSLITKTAIAITV
jgi:hypothetical protein